MNDPLPDKITLCYRRGTSDKVYYAEIAAKHGGYIVNFAFGRRGAALTTGTKTPSPVPLHKVRAIFEKLIREKMAKGYTATDLAAENSPPPTPERSTRARTAKQRAMQRATSLPKKKGEANTAPVPPVTAQVLSYELIFIGYHNDEIEAELHSPLLDTALHPSQEARVIIETAATARSAKPRFLLDSFHLESLTEYLRSQAYVRQTLESELPRDRDRWDQDNNSAGRNRKVWQDARVSALELRRRDAPSPQLLARLKKEMTRSELREELAGMDLPDTRSFFTVVLDCDWDEEHSVQARFRDGVLAEIDHE